MAYHDYQQFNVVRHGDENMTTYAPEDFDDNSINEEERRLGADNVNPSHVQTEEEGKFERRMTLRQKSLHFHSRSSRQPTMRENDLTHGFHFV